MASWFKQRRDKSGDQPDDGDQLPDVDPAESTIEVKAQVIAEAVRAADAQQQQQQPVGSQSGIGSDGLVSGSDFGAEFDAARDPGAGQAGTEAMLLDQALAERKSLVQLCLYALDRARSAGVAERIEEGLAGVGVDAVRPDGVRFDPAHHEAGGTVATGDETLDGIVAETEVVGFSDRGEVLRAPIVTVYSKAAQGTPQ